MEYREKMSWFGGAVDAVAGAVEGAANAVGEVVSDAVESVGNAVEDVTDATLGKMPVLGPVLGWLGGIVSDSLDLAGAAIKGHLGIVGGLYGGSIRIALGIVGLDRRLVLKGIGDIGLSIAGAVLLVGGKAIALVQSILLLEARERRLTDAELRLLRRVFRGSVAFYNVRLVEGRAGIFGITGRAFVLGNTIYLQRRDVSRDPGLLVHECTHVWQYQHVGARYASEALWAQAFIEDAYSWEREIQRGNDRWICFNREAQAAFLEDVFTRGALARFGAILHGNGVFYDADGVTGVGRFAFHGVDSTDTANDAVAAVRSRVSLRLSSLV